MPIWLSVAGMLRSGGILLFINNLVKSMDRLSPSKPAWPACVDANCVKIANYCVGNLYTLGVSSRIWCPDEGGDCFGVELPAVSMVRRSGFP